MAVWNSCRLEIGSVCIRDHDMVREMYESYTCVCTNDFSAIRHFLSSSVRLYCTQWPQEGDTTQLIAVHFVSWWEERPFRRLTRPHVHAASWFYLLMTLNTVSYHRLCKNFKLFSAVWFYNFEIWWVIVTYIKLEITETLPTAKHRKFTQFQICLRREINR